jgi:Glycosyltransferase family 87
MGGFIEAMRSGAWLTRERARLWAVAVLIASLAGVLYIVATAHGLSDYQGRPIGTDFSNVYAAGTYVLEGKPALPFDAPAQHAREKEIFGPATPFYGWHYPPLFLFVAAALALLPYLAALAVWQGASLVLYLLSIRAIIAAFRPSPLWGGSRAEGTRGGVGDADNPHPAAAPPTSPTRGEVMWLLLALAYPAVFVNLGHGQNGFLTAGLLGFALLLLERRPIAAGILFGLLAYKPQFGVLIPLVLIATGRWRTFAAAAATVILLLLAATAAFGVQVWPAFFKGAQFTREVVLESGNTGWEKIQSVFSWVRMWGGPVPLAYAIQAVVTLMAAAATVWLWRSRSAGFPVKAAGLILASLLATPYSLDYDLMVLAPAIAFLATEGVARGFLPWEKTVLAALWLMPLIARSFAEFTFVPLGAPLMLIAFALLLRRSVTACVAANGAASPANSTSA